MDLNKNVSLSFADACARTDTPDKIARASTSPATRRRVRMEARAIRSANMPTSASALRVSENRIFFLHLLSCHKITPSDGAAAPNPAKDETFRINAYYLSSLVSCPLSDLALATIRSPQLSRVEVKKNNSGVYHTSRTFLSRAR